MKKYIPKISAIVLIILGGWLLGTHAAQAQITDVAKFFGFDLANLVAQAFAYVFNMLQIIASWLLILSGTLLNYSINLTLQMKTFLEQTPAVYTTWKALRDITGLFIIFALLYAAMKMILSIQDEKFGNLIKNIVVAGVVINFSFFFVGLGIDASNIVSIQLYNAIAPANSLNEGNLVPGGITNQLKDGGLSDIFMKSLKIPALYDTKGVTAAGQAASAAGGAWTTPIKIMLFGIASIIIMLTAALSFAAAALAFVVRFVVLIFLIAFSPIWFASHIVPEIGEYAKKWTGAYKGMLVFMPVYLLLMYLALSVLTTTPFLASGSTPNIAALAEGSSDIWYSSIIGLAINAVIVIILINFPLLAAISIGGTAVKFINADKIGAAGVSRWVRNNTVGAAATRIIGGTANALDKKIGGSRVGNLLVSRDLRAVTTGALAKNKFGTSRSYEDLEKVSKEISKKDKEIVRRNELDTLIKNKAPLVDIAAKMKEMGDKEKLALGADRLKNEMVVAHLKGSDFEAIKKAEEGFDDNEKKAIADARTAALKNALKNKDGDAVTVKNMVNEMDGKDLLKLAGSSPDLLSDSALIEHLKQSQLKVLEDEGLNVDLKKKIAQEILSATPPHKSVGFIRKRKVSWGLEENDDGSKSKPNQIIAASGSENPPKFKKSYS